MTRARRAHDPPVAAGSGRPRIRDALASVLPERWVERARLLADHPLLAPSPSRVPRAVVSCVYRERNAAWVLDVVQQIPAHWEVRLWALDHAADPLRAWTLGEGPGARFNLVNRLIESRTPPPDAFLVVCDDDVQFVRGDLLALVHMAAVCGADLAQPTHVPQSTFNIPHTARKPGLLARVSDFIEQGPSSP